MPQDPAASRMMNTLQNSLSQDSQQFINPAPQVPVLQPLTPAPPSLGDNPGQTIGVTAGQTAPTSADITDQQKLALFEQVIQEVENAQVAAPPQPVSSASKERIEVASLVAPQELPGGMQYVESEPVPEIPPEVESFLQQAQEQPEKLPEEIVRAAEQFQQESSVSNAPQAVKVLPITKDQAEVGAKKSTAFSLRWLVEFSNKISRLFAGKSIYRAD